MNLVTASMIAAGTLLLPVVCALAGEPAKGIVRVPVEFREGHDTDPRDRGRPVVLIAAALGVPDEVFRDAFRGVTPAPAGTKPTREQQQRNKSVLMNALGKHGVTNERLDEVSDHYRYARSRGELWTHTPAKAVALVRDGEIVGYELIDGGSGYSSAPRITVPNAKGPAPVIRLSFGKDLKTNGSIAALTLPQAKDR